MNDDDLHEKLSAWEPVLPEEPGFQKAVWHRIDSESAPVTFSGLVNSAADFVTRPVVGIPVAAAIITFAIVLAVHNGTESRDETWSDLAASYGMAINPISHTE